MKKENVSPGKLVTRIMLAAGFLPATLAWAAYGAKAIYFSKSQDQNIPWISNLKPDGGGGSGSQGPRRDRGILKPMLVILFIVFIIGGFFGLALYRARNISNPAKEQVSSTAGGLQVSCQELIDRAMQASDDSCDQMGSNQVCYGNNTLLAELIAGTASRFSQRGDRVSVADLKRLAASPLSLASEEWGIAVFKVMANLPRSLPGETITMVVFGNTTLDNPSNNLQTFYFSSALGQIECDQVPFDGLMITMPDGTGVSFIINGAEMTLMGNASITAARNGSMEVSMFSGSASVTVNGQYQIVTAGQSTSMALGGPDGTTAISPPSPPQPLSPEDLTLACTMTGNFCSQTQITPVSPLDAVATLITLLGLDISTDSGNGSSTPAIVASPTSFLILQGTNTNPSSSQSQQTATLIPSNTNTMPPTLTLPPMPTETIPPPTNTFPPPTNTSPPPTNPPPPTEVPKITICHCPSADQTGCNEITITNTGSGGHWDHPYDIIPAPADGCP